MASFLAILLLLSLAFFGEAGASPTESAQEKPVIVVLVPLSGELARAGRQLVEAAEFAGDELGVRILALDEGESVEEMLANLSTLNEREDVAAIIGPVQRGRATAAARQAQQMGLPLVVYSPQHDVERMGDRIFRARPDAQAQSRVVATYLVEEAGLTRVGVMGPRTSFGDALVAALVQAVVDAGGTVRALSRYEEGTTDFRPALEVLVGRRAFVQAGRSINGRRADRFHTLGLGREPDVPFEALIIVDHHEVVARILPFLPRVGIQTGAGGAGVGVQLVGLAGWRGDGLQRAGEHAAGAIFFDTFGGESDGGQSEEFSHRFRERTGRAATTAEAEIYDLVGMIGSGLRARQEGESWADAALARLREPTSYPGVSGSWSFSDEGAPVRHLRAYRVIDGGRWVPLQRGLQ